MKTQIKSFFVAVIIVSAVNSTFSQNAEKVFPLSKVYQTHGWYTEQARLWEKQVDKNPNDASAWENLYRAKRYEAMTGENEREQKKKEQEKLLADMGKAIPNSFEYHYLKFLNGNQYSDYFADLEKAYQLNPSRPEPFYDFISNYEIRGEKQKMKDFCQKLYDTKDIAPGLLEYNYNVLMSVEKDGILLTNGDNDTYPIWILQNAKGIREDVSVLNIYLATSFPDYAKRFFLENKIDLDFDKLPRENGEISKPTLCKKLAEKSISKPVFFALSMDGNYIAEVKDKLYLVGLAYQYSEKRIDNLAMLKKNWEKNFRLDNLTCEFYGEDYPASELVKKINGNYIMPMMVLYDHSKTAGEIENTENLKILAMNVAKETGNENKLSQYLENKTVVGNSENKSVLVIKIKEFDKHFKVPVKENLFGCEIETSNEMYRLFLTDLVNKKQLDLLKMCQPDTVNWDDYFSHSIKNWQYRYTINNDTKQPCYPDDKRNPAYGMSYEAANEYCKWLTETYNLTPKRKYKKVLFRLPSEEEWELAAKAGTTADEYPWDATALKWAFSTGPANQKGCFLANFKTFDDLPNEDGAFYTAPIDSYWPNDYGLYNMVGNVSEMVAEKGKAKGGNFTLAPHLCTIKSVQTYTKKEAWLGFRIFMDVLEKY